MTIASLPVINRILNKLRRQTVGTREYIVAPVTLIVPGVLDGSEGPLYYPPHEIARNYHEWNDTPVTINHPLMNGAPVSARTPTVYLSQGVGRIHDARINSEGKLRAEAWIDVEALSSLSPSTLKRIEAGEPIEVSTGLYTTNIRAEEGANFDGKPYKFVARNYKPDHLAILPDQVGACSLNDGCGLNVNAKGRKVTTTNDKADALTPLIDDLVNDLINGHGPTINIWSKRAREAAARARRAGGHVLKHFAKRAKRFALRQVAKVRSAPKRIAKALERKAEKITGKAIPKGKASKGKPSKSRETLGKRQRILDAIEVKTNPSKKAEKAKQGADREIKKRRKERQEKKPRSIKVGGKRVETFGFAKNSLREFLINAGVCQPRSMNSGKFKKFGAGTGKGKGHEAAQRGSLQLTDEDYKEGRELVGNPGWVKDKAKWKKAKQAAKEGEYSGDQLWAVTTKIYKGMGGSIIKQPKAKTMNSARERVISVLTANCSCWKNKEETLRTMDGAQLNGVYQAYKATQNGKKGTKNKKKGKTDPSMMQDDEEAEGEGEMKTNSLSVKQWLQMMPEGAKPIWNHAVNLEKETRKQLVERLTANVSDEAKKAKLVEKLSKLPVADLQERLELVGNAQQVETQTTGIYVGQTGVIPTTNNGRTKGINKDEPLRRPTLNFQEMSKESRSA